MALTMHTVGFRDHPVAPQACGRAPRGGL